MHPGLMKSTTAWFAVLRLVVNVILPLNCFMSAYASESREVMQHPQPQAAIMANIISYNDYAQKFHDCSKQKT